MSDALRIERHATLPSTNDRALALFEGDVDLILADSQSGGRGRMGRRFESPEGGLYMSFIRRTPIPSERLLRITPLIAVAVRRALGEIGVDCGIKWVNDLMAEDKKLCGILVQPRFRGEICIGAVIGIGINLRGGMLSGALSDTAISVQELTGESPDRGALARSICAHIRALLDAEDDADAMAEYAAASVLIGKSVTVTRGERSFEATVQSIDTSGFLHVLDESGREIILQSGEATLHRGG